MSGQDYKAKKNAKNKDKKPTKPVVKMSLATKRKIFASFWLFFLVVAYISLFFVPKFPNALWLRLLLPLIFTPLMARAVFSLIKKRLTAEDLAFVEKEENQARALRSLILTKFYTKPMKGFPHGVRKEIFPTIGIGVLLFLVMCFVSPCRPPEAPMPDFSLMAAQELYFPQLYLASDSQAILAPVLLSAETEKWAEKIPPRYLEWTMYADMFQNHAENAYAAGNLEPNKTMGVYLAMAQASMLLGEYDRAVAEYHEAIALGYTAPGVALQHAIALVYAGKLNDAEKALDALNAKEVAKSVGDGILAHWKLVVKLLQGDASDGMCGAYESFYRKQETALKKVTKELDSAKDTPKNASKNTSNADALQAQLNMRRCGLRSALNNMAVLQVLTGNYANAAHTAGAVLPLASTVSARSATVLEMCASNTKGFVAAHLGKTEDLGNMDYVAYFTQTRTQYETYLKQSRVAEDGLDESFRTKSPFYLLPLCNEIQFALMDEFTSEKYPDADAFRKTYGTPLDSFRKMHAKWIKTDIANVPIWAVPIETLLLCDALILEGLEQEENYTFATQVCEAHYPKSGSFPLVDLRTKRMNLYVLSRFAAKEALMINMLDNLLDEQKKTSKMTKEVVSETHPILARQALETLRLTLSKTGLKKKELGTIQASLTTAQEVMTPWKYPAGNVYMRELAEAQRIVEAMKKRDLAEIQAVYEPEIEKLEKDHFRQASAYRDLAFALQHRGFTTESDVANRSARAIFNQQIYRSNNQHFLILQMDKILKH